MGYRTVWSLSVEDGAQDSAIRERLTVLAYGDISPFAEDGRWHSSECKWYSRREDCVKVASEHPLTSFTITWDGEDDDDFGATAYRGPSSSTTKECPRLREVYKC